MGFQTSLKLFEKQIGTGGTDQWQLDAKAGQTVIFHSRAETSQPVISVRNRSGVELARSGKSSAGNDSVLAYRFPDDGTYSVWIHLPRGTNYRLQTFPTD